MARARNIKPGFYKNEDLAECSVWARLIFPGLWMLADREGRLEDRPKRIKGELLPFDSQDVEPLLNELQARGFLERYRNEDGSFIQISKFKDHQSPHFSEKPSAIKPPDSGNLSPSRGTNSEKPSAIKPGAVAENSGNIASLRGGRNPLNPDSLNPESRKGEQAAPAPRTAKRPAQTRMPEGFAVSDRVRQWAASRGFGMLDEHLDAFRRKVAANGYTAVSWDDKFMEAIREDWAKLRIGKAPRDENLFAGAL
jgi:hypothetical protein